jgi:hypothetical protein
MRAALPFLLAAVLGVGSGVIAACGSGSGDRSNLIPQSSADRMKSALSDVRSAVGDGNCDSAEQALARARGVLVNLPASVDEGLRTRLKQGLDNLRTIVPTECRQQSTSTPTTTPETTTTQSTATNTTPTNTTPTDTTPTNTTTTTPTTSTGTTTTPPPTTTTTPAAPPADTTGGVTTP